MSQTMMESGERIFGGVSGMTIFHNDFTKNFYLSNHNLFIGPDAMYVKLISSDGHEFIVKREHALTSGTIKAMLSGPGQFAENEANEVNFREIPYVIRKFYNLR